MQRIPVIPAATVVVVPVKLDATGDLGQRYSGWNSRVHWFNKGKPL